MTPGHILDINNRHDFRAWLQHHSTTEKECWIAAKRGKTPPLDALWYLDAVEEALCFGWIDSTVKMVNGMAIQRFSPRRKGSQWTELNKERCRRLIKLGMMTEQGLQVCPDLNAEFTIHPDILTALKANPTAWNFFQSFPTLYQRVRIDNIQRKQASEDLFDARLQKLISASERGKMIGEWNDGGRLLDY